MTERVVSVDRATLVPRPPEWQPGSAAAHRFDAARALLGATLGLQKLGVSVIQVAPGRSAYPFHSHRANDELFFMLSGRGELRLGQARHAVQAGDLVGCPAGGPDSAHQLVNSGTEPLRDLAVSTQIDPEICEYPDSGKAGACAGDDEPGELMHLTRYGQALDDWDGE